MEEIKLTEEEIRLDLERANFIYTVVNSDDPSVRVRASEGYQALVDLYYRQHPVLHSKL